MKKTYGKNIKYLNKDIIKCYFKGLKQENKKMLIIIDNLCMRLNGIR